MREINAGDKVKCFWVEDGAELEGVVLSMPQTTGDLLYIKNKDGDIHAINTNCSDFSSMIKFVEKN